MLWAELLCSLVYKKLRPHCWTLYVSILIWFVRCIWLMAIFLKISGSLDKCLLTSFSQAWVCGWSVVKNVAFCGFLTGPVQKQWLMLTSQFLLRAQTHSPLTHHQIHQRSINTPFLVKVCVCVCAWTHMCVPSIPNPSVSVHYGSLYLD